MKRVFLMMLGLMMTALSARAQTADDLNEGLLVTAGAQEGEFTLSWWGKTGRTYFVQQSFDLMAWQYVPVVEAGAAEVCGLNFTCTDPRQFWRLRYTDQAYSGNVEDADFDGDSLTNLEEATLGTDPFKADTDDDGWDDLRESQRGSNALNEAETPLTVNPNYINTIRLFETEVLSGSSSYYMDRSKQGDNWDDWNWVERWNDPGDAGLTTGSGDEPTLVLRLYPFPALGSSQYWQPEYLAFQQYAPPSYLSTQPNWHPYAQRGMDSFEGKSFQYENAWRGFRWYRCRIRLSEAVPFEHQEHFLAVSWRYDKNPDHNVPDAPTAEWRWRRVEVESVTPMTLSIPAGSLTGTWAFQAPTATADDTMSVVQMVPIEFEVTKWEPIITQPLDPYTTGENRNPPANEIDDEVFVANPPNSDDTFVLNVDVKLKPLPIPASDLPRVASEWKVAILQDVVALPTADYKTYIGEIGGAGAFVTTMAPVPGMDAVFSPDDPPDPDNYFEHKNFTTGGETLSLRHEDTPAPEAFGGVRIYQNGNAVNAAVALINLKRDVTFMTWVYAEHVPTKSRQFLRWVRWQTSWDVDVDGNNFAPPKLTKKTYTFRKIDEGTGEGPVPPSFTKAQKSAQFVPAQ